MIKKKDIILFIAVLIVAGAMALFFRLGQGESGGLVRIMIDGEEYGTYRLEINESIEVMNDFGYNRIVIEKGQVFMEEADCPDQYCVAHRAISKTKETIVCLPHKLVVEIHALPEENGIDAVTQ